MIWIILWNLRSTAGRTCFIFPWDNGNSARAVIDEFGGSYKNTVLAIAAGAGDSWYAGSTYSVFNLEEWLSEDWDTLAEANKAGFLKQELGGAVLFQKDKAAKRAKLQKELEDFNSQKKWQRQLIKEILDSKT